MSEVEKLNSPSVAGVQTSPDGLTETQHSAGLAAAIAELNRMLSEGLRGRTHDVWQRAYNAGVRDARRVLNAALVAAPEPDGLCAERSRAAFRAGWYVNAAADDQPAEYLAGCEDADWRGYLRSRPLSSEAPSVSPSEASAGNPVADEPLPTLQSQARRVEELEAALRKICSEFSQRHPLIIAARSALSEGSGSSRELAPPDGSGDACGAAERAEG